jgi:membrane protein YdbS with pleckstrin-like domain
MDFKICMTKKKLHPGARWLWRVGSYIPGIILLIVLTFFIGSFIVATIGSIAAVFVVFIVLLVIIIALIEIFITLAYNRWFYELGKEGIRIERGIIWKKYSSIPYGRVQNVDIRRGVIARIIGFSTMEIQTAGYSGGYHGRYGHRRHSEGYIPAVGIQEAEKIREMLMKKIGRRSRGV